MPFHVVSIGPCRLNQWPSTSRKSKVDYVIFSKMFVQAYEKVFAIECSKEKIRKLIHQLQEKWHHGKQ
jgi:hypothetical protein